MSTGYSGNLGFLMPENWAFEQYYEKKNYELANFSFDLDYDMASGRDEGFSEEFCPINENDYLPPYSPTTEEISDMEPILNLIPAIKWLEEVYYIEKGITNPNAAQKIDCSLAVLDYLYQYQFQDLIFDINSPRDDAFVGVVNEKYTENNYYKQLQPYIYAKEEGKGNDKIVTRAQLLTDGILGVFELPHLAIVIKCYISALAPGSWAAWAGDFASAVKETYVNAEVKEKPSSLFYTASKRIGAMEADVISITEARLFNYCDLIADIDGYAVRQLMLGNNSEYALSECIREYYSERSKFYKRYQYFKLIIGYEYWNVIDIKENILKHFSPILKLKFAEDADCS